MCFTILIAKMHPLSMASINSILTSLSWLDALILIRLCSSHTFLYVGMHPKTTILHMLSILTTRIYAHTFPLLYIARIGSPLRRLQIIKAERELSHCSRVTVLYKVRPPGTSCVRLKVCRSELRKLSRRVADTWVKSKDVTVSCESFRLSCYGVANTVGFRAN